MTLHFLAKLCVEMARSVAAVQDSPRIPPGAKVAYHQYPACGDTNFNEIRLECNEVARTQFDFMGYTMRTPDFRYTRWLRWNQTNLTSEWDGDFAEELYNHTLDHGTTFGLFESYNLAQALPEVREGEGVEHMQCMTASVWLDP